MNLEHFDMEEFRDWADEMSPRLLTMLDILRHQLGRAVIISTNPHSLGRSLGRNDTSAHNIDHWGEVLAADFFVENLTHRVAVEDVYQKMKRIGFTGIGVYSDTYYLDKPHTMFHGDVRPNERMGQPATWGRINNRYTSLTAAIQSLSIT